MTYMKAKSSDEILNQWWASGIRLGSPGGASGSVTHIGSATVFIGGGSVTANMGNIPSIGGITPSFTGTAMDVTTTVNMGNIPSIGGVTPSFTGTAMDVTAAVAMGNVPSIGGATPTFTGGAQHFILAGASPVDATYIGDIKFGEELPAGTNVIGAVTLGLVTANVVLTGASTIDATYIGDIKFGESLPAGTNVIGAVTFGVLPVGTNIIGAVTLGDVTLASPTDATYIGDIKFGEALPAGTNVIGSATVFIGGGSVTANMGNIPSIGGVTPSFTGTAMDVTTTVNMGNIPSIGGATPTFTGGAQHFVLTGASTLDATYIGDIKFGEELPAGTQHIGSATVYVFGGALSATVTLIAGGQVSATTTLLASEVHVGEIGGNTIVTSASPVLSAASPYVSGYLAGTGGVLTFLNAGRTAGNTGVVQSVVLTDAGMKNKAFDLVLFNELPATTVFAGCTPFVVAAADLFKIAGVTNIAASDYASFSTKSVATKANVGIVYDLPSTTTTLFGALVIRAAATYAATDLSLRLGLLRD